MHTSKNIGQWWWKNWPKM